MQLLFSFSSLANFRHFTLHVKQNGKLLRSLKSHAVAVVSLNWVEDSQLITVCNSPLIYLLFSMNFIGKLWC